MNNKTPKKQAGKIVKNSPFDDKQYFNEGIFQK